MEILRMDFVMAEILPKLPVKSLMRFKCVCKAFNDLITSPEFIQRQLCQSQSSDTNRLLVVPGGGRCVQVFDLDSPESPVTSFIWCENSFISVVGSCNGLLCVIRRDRGYTHPILLNPSTQKLLALNFSGLRQYIGCCVNYGFGFDDTNKDYKIVVVLEGYDNIVRKRDVSVYSLKTNSWRMVDRSSPQDSMEQRFGGVLINNHLLHWKFWCPSKSKRRIGCFDIQSELWKDDVLLPEYYYHPAEKNFLLDFGALDGCLYSSFENRQNSTFDIWVMKEYGAQDSWMKLLTIPTSDDLQGGIVPIVSRLGSGYDVLVRQRHQFKLFWCNKKNNAIIRAKFRGISEFSNLQAYICKGSLVSIPGSTQYIAAQPEEDRM